VGLVYADPPMWALKAFARPLLARLMGVPTGLSLDDADVAFMAEMMDSFFPIAPRVRGIVFDAYVSNPDVNSYLLERLTVPTLVIHAKDDQLCSFAAAGPVG
jgi:pimeloyl-ACP methyl ester carboxylesterase